MKVYGITAMGLREWPKTAGHEHNPQYRIIACAGSRKRAVELMNLVGLNMTTNHMRNYGTGPTNNPTELAAATDADGCLTEGVWYVHDPMSWSGEATYTKAEPKEAT